MLPSPYPISDHFNGSHFHNPELEKTPDRRGFRELLRWQLDRRGRGVWPSQVIDPVYPPPTKPGPGEAVITFIGHASFLLQLPGITLITDPHFSTHASPVRGIGPRRVRAPGIALQDLPPIDVVLVSHNHYDHLDLPSLRALQRAHAPKSVTLLGNARFMAPSGLQALELDWWQDIEIGELRITATSARHFSRRGLLDGNRALWGGFMLHHSGGAVFFAGDSGAGPHWAQIGAKLGAPDLALLPIGAYEPRWLMKPVHMNPDEALEAHVALAARQSIAMHFGTFRLTDEAIDAPVERLAEVCAGSCVSNFEALGVGESRRYPLNSSAGLDRVSDP